MNAHDRPSSTEDQPGAASTRSRPPTGPTLSLHTLGTFEVVEDQATVALPPGLPAQAIKFVVAGGGRVHAEALIDGLWPEAGLAEGRKGVRNVLARLQRAGAPVLTRDGEAIRVADGISVDALAFQATADRVLTDQGRAGAADGARFALARYRGEFLPDDRYCDWAEPTRQRLRRRHLALLDLLAADARRRHEHLEAVTLLELAIEADPSDDARYTEAADLLIRLGRRGRAAALLDQARAALREFGLEPDETWRQVHRRLAGAGASGPRRPEPASVSRVGAVPSRR